MADVSQLLITVDSDGVRTATGDLDLLTKTGKKTQKTTETLDQSAKKLTKQFERQGKTVGMTAGQIKILELKEKGATKAQLDAARAALKNAEALKQQADAARFASQSAGETGGSFRAMRGSTQQLSWQLQDVAVQAQMGTSAFTILGQQGPQIASIFGSGGAVFGVIVAFGAILGGLLFKAITGTGEAMKRLDAEMDNLNDGFDSLGNEAKRLQRALAVKEIEENNVQIAKLQKEYDNLTSGIGNTIESFGNYTDHSESASEKTDDLRSKILGLGRSNVKLAKQTDDLTDDTESLTARLTEEFLALKLTDAQLIHHKALQAGATAEQANAIVSLHNLITAEELALEVKKDAEAAVQKQIETTQNYTISLNNQLMLLNLSGDALFLYQARLKGGTVAEIEANAALLKSIALRKEKIKADADFAKNELALAALFDKLTAKKIADEEKAKESAIAFAKKEALRGLEKLDLLKEQQKAARIQLDADLAARRITQELHDEAMEGQARETAAVIADIDKKANEDAKKTADARMQIQQQMLSGISGVIGQLADAAEEGSSEAKALFAIEKAIAIATTVINAEAAGAAAMLAMPGPPGILMGNVIRGIGYASAGIIAGTSIAGGRALGGQVRGGESYLVGERGPELLTMGTSGRVTSNDALKNSGNGADVVINQTINVTTGIQSTVRAEIVALMPQISNAAKGAVADARLRGGNFSKAMAGA